VAKQAKGERKVLISTKSLKRMGIEAIDGEVGKIADVYFDDVVWNVQYIVANTGSWLPGRKVLLPRAVLKNFDASEGACQVKLTKAEIHNSPPIYSDEPVSRRQETSLLGYFKLVPYWGADIPSASYESGPQQSEPGTGQGDPNLRSCNEVYGYQIEATDGEIGKLDDLIVDDRTWIFRYAVVDTRKWLPGRRVLVAIPWARSVSWARSRVQIDLTKEEIKGSPEFDARKPINREYEAVLYDYYGRPGYWGDPGRK
jgi:hypothetical protein